MRGRKQSTSISVPSCRHEFVTEDKKTKVEIEYEGQPATRLYQQVMTKIEAQYVDTTKCKVETVKDYSIRFFVSAQDVKIKKLNAKELSFSYDLIFKDGKIVLYAPSVVDNNRIGYSIQWKDEECE